VPARTRRDEEQPPRPPRLPGAGSVSPESAPGTGRPAAAPVPEPDPGPPLPEPAEPAAYEVLARFATAARALSFAEQAMRAAQRDSADCFRGADGSWWVAATLLLGPAREMSGLGEGRLYVSVAGGFTADRGWGDDPAAGQAATLPDRTRVTLLDLVQVAGLHRVPPAPLQEASVLAPGYLVRGVLERAQDLRLRASYQLVQLDPLFGTAGVSRSCYAVWLATAAGREALPVTLLSALADDPFTLVCRRIDRTLLVDYGTASPLSDQGLTRLVAAEGGGTWLLARPPDGCARVTWADEPLDAAGLVELGPAHALVDLDGNQPYAEASAAAPPVPRPLTLAPAAARAARVDAILLDDTDLEFLPLLLAGDPLADTAILIRGATRHLLTAPGGLLTELSVGEPLTCVGPGSLYVPTGFRLDPPLGPAARAAIFRPDKRIAQVLRPDARLGYDLDAAEPVWVLWAGPVPELDSSLPRQALADLDQAAREIGEPPRVPDRRRSLLNRIRPRPADPEPDPSAWRQQAFQAERDRDYVTAAQLYARHNEPLRAARMWEREAAEKY
jgi:hypothetical protein